MNELFPDHPDAQRQRPLAARMRPQSIDEVVGQAHIISEGKLLRRAIEADRLDSLILYGPPGCGKTTLAEVIAKSTRREFERASGILGNVAGLRKILEAARQRRLREGRETVLFIDEIHRFNKSQQDTLLPYVEEGDVTLIGATTHNPFFFVNSPLVSRSRVFQLEPVPEADLITLMQRALTDPRGLSDINAEVDDEALAHLASVCEGDARKVLNALEIAVMTTAPSDDGIIRVHRSEAEESIQKKAVVYDKDEDEHYDTISAFIKSVRGSDPDAAIYWLAKMLVAGEDPRFIARRLIILASEDIGNADPRGLTLAVSTLQAVEFIGMPEAKLTLSQTTTYLATAPKSNSATTAIFEAMKDVESGKVLPVPKHLRDGHYAGAKKLGHTGYQYAHDGEHHFVDQEYAPTDKNYYKPGSLGYEKTIRERLKFWDNLREHPRNHENQS
ncbi:replication-associated recombination protein A [Kiritimatiellota bacterium B12222]|nr:replication-associated recombination protein A [Kiritimatiellota bacterium B12222]